MQEERIPLPPSLAERINAPETPELVSPVQLCDEIGGLLSTFADLHQALARSLRGEMVTRAEAANYMSRLCLQAGDAFRRLQ